MSRPHVLGICWVLVVAALAGGPSEARPVIGPGHEALFLEMGNLGPGGPRLDGVSIERDAVTWTYVVGERSVRVRLVHPDVARDALATTGKFKMIAVGGEVPPDLVRDLAARIRSLEARFEWAVESAEHPAPAGNRVPFAPALPEDATPFELLRTPTPALPEHAASMEREARDLLSKGRKKAAARKALSLVRSHPGSVAVRRVAASILRSAGDGKRAVEVLRDILALPGGSTPEVRIEVAASRIAAGRLDEATALLAQDSRAPAVCRLVEVLTLLAREGRLDLASAHAPPMAHDSPRCLAVFHLKLAHASGDDDRVDAAAATGLRASADDESLLYLWGYHFYAKRAMDRAIPPWDRLLARNPHFPAVLGQAGTAYLVAGHLDRAGIDRMLERLARNPGDLVASFLAGLGLYYLKDYGRVVPLLEPVVRAVPDESRARLYLAMAHYFLGHQETAERMFEEMEPYAYHDPDIYYCRSLIYRKRDLPRAIREMERFLQVFVGEGRLSFGPEKVQKARSDLERMRRGEVPELNLPGDPLVPAK